MTRKQKMQMIIDLAMTALLPLLMAYSLIGEAVHEWLGMTMLLFFIIHHIINRMWLRSFFKGRYTGVRIMGTVVNVLLGIIMIALPLSGIAMSNHVFPPINIDVSMSIARTVHLFVSYWGFILMSVHLGFHWNRMVSVLEKVIVKKINSLFWNVCMKYSVLLIAFFGICSFGKHRIHEYMLLKTQFVFFDFGKPVVLFLLDYLVIMMMFACIGYYAKLGVVKMDKTRNTDAG